MKIFVMKLVLLLSLLHMTFLSFGQSESQQEIDSLKLSQIDTEIENFRVKREYVKSDPYEDSVAVSEDWYLFVEKQLILLFDKKKQIILSMTGKQWVSLEEFEAKTEEEKAQISANESYLIETE